MFGLFSSHAQQQAIKAMVIAGQSDPITTQARALGSELAREHAIEQLRRKHEDVCLVLAFSGCVNLAVIIWFLVQAAKAVVSF